MARDILGDPAGRPYSPGTRVGNMVFVSGQLGLDSAGKIVPGGIGPQTRQTIENMKTVLAEAGATLDDVTMVNIYMKDLDEDYDAMNAVYLEYFGATPPARATVEISRLAFNLPIEISCIAVLKS